MRTALQRCSFQNACMSDTGYRSSCRMQGTRDNGSYTFCHWALTDVFVYFSHVFITIPPPGWTDAAHTNGVKASVGQPCTCHRG